MIPRLPGELIVVLGDEVLLKAEASNEREFIRDPLEVCYLAPGRPLRNHQPVKIHSVGDARDFVVEVADKLNGLFECIYAVHQLRTDHRRADCTAVLKRSFVVERLAQAVLSIATAESEYVRMNEAFGMLDMICGLASARLAGRVEALPVRPGASNNAVRAHRSRLLRSREPALADALLSPAGLRDLVQRSLRAWACTPCAHLVQTAAAQLNSLHATTRQSLFLAPPNAGPVRIRFREVDDETGRRGRWRTRQIKAADLAGQVVRQLRNTHHGYDLYDQLFEGLLALSDGGLGDHLPSYMEHVWLALLANPDSWLGGDLAAAVSLPRHVG